jgi:hypothetical protein
LEDEIAFRKKKSSLDRAIGEMINVALNGKAYTRSQNGMDHPIEP